MFDPNVTMAVSSIIATGFTFSHLFFRRVDKLEATFVESIRRINETVNRLDKSIVVLDNQLNRDKNAH